MVWVRFADRGPLTTASPAARKQAALAQMSARSLARRAARARLFEPLESDLPVYSGYVDALAERGFRVRAVSRWLNAASVVAPRARLGELRALRFVQGVQPVPKMRRRRDTDPEEQPVPIDEGGGSGLSPESAGRAFAAPTDSPGTPGFYGNSYTQVRMIEADRLQAVGLSGRGVLVTMLDTGFRETHAAFESLRVVARRDFIYGDTVVVNEAGQDSAGQNNHGTMCLSILAGYEPGVLVGTAYGADVALGKTEWVPSEQAVEMDYWQMGAEWADSLGADAISTSLGYFEFDDPTDSYEYIDMNGHTTVVTLAAAEAARRGITVVCAQGNEGQTPWHYLVAPADAESVCAVGAVDSFRVVTGFSSYGPSADGRVKPDVCAMGAMVAVASPSNNTAILRGGGTSFATPAVGGLVALLLEAHPTWGPFEVLEALRSTADRFDAPDDHYGYGIARGELATSWIPSTTDTGPGPGPPPLVLVGPNPVATGGRIALRLRMGEAGGPARVEVFDARGRRARELLDRELPEGAVRAVSWDGRDASGRSMPPGLYFARFTAPGVRASARFVLLF